MYSSYNKHTHSQPKEDLKYTHTCIQPSHTQMYSIIHTYMYSIIHTQKCIQSYTCIHAHSQINVFNHTTNTHIHSPKKILNTHIHVTLNPSHTQMYSIIHTQKCIQSYTHIHVFNHTHTHTNVLNHTHIHVFNHTHIYGTY